MNSYKCKQNRIQLSIKIFINIKKFLAKFTHICSILSLFILFILKINICVYFSILKVFTYNKNYYLCFI